MTEHAPPSISETHGWLDDADRRKLKDVYQSDTACFSDLVELSDLNPAVDFRFADLTGVDFSGSDLRGYNFVGANLSYTRWFKATWDTTTNLEGALLTGARGYERALTSGTAVDVLPQPFFENTPMAVARVDKHCKILSGNTRYAELTRSIAAANVGGSILSAVHPRDREILEAAIIKATKGRHDNPPIEALLADDKERWGQFFVTTEDATLETAHIYVLDISERRSLEHQLNQSQKMEMVGQLAGGIAHDFNNVLSAIMMANDFLLNAHKPTDPSFQDLMQIKQNTTRAATLVRQLLAFSRRQTLQPQVLDLGDALSDLTMLLRRLIGEKIKLELVHGRDLWPIKVDVSQFEQVIVNLAVNARDAMPDGGRLTVKTANLAAEDSVKLAHRGLSPADYVRIDVLDTGTGIPANIIDNVFEPFFSTKKVGKGTGLGLSTVYGIVKQSGGVLFVTSVVSQGTSFSILFPRHQPSAETRPSNPGMRMVAWHKAAPAVYTETISVLLVEPDSSLRSLNARGMRSRGYTVVEAADGVEALGVYITHGNKFDIVVSEVHLAEMDGPALYREIRKRNADQPFIFVSGYAEDVFEDSFPEGEIVAFLPKPFVLDQLIVAITNEIGLRVS
ncbi:signal transduction histidine kinase/ActR/RegA family two-component response regulator [Bradyrhizobium sp. AZCC 1678]